MFLGRTIYSDWAMSKSKFCEKLEKGLSGNQEANKSFRYFSSQAAQKGEHVDGQDDDSGEHNEHGEDGEHETHEEEDDSKISKKKEKDDLKKQKRKKLLKKIKAKKRARIVIRNLSFQVWN